MADDRADDHGGFVFGDDRSGETDATDDRISRKAVAAAVFFVAVVVFAALAYPFVSSAVTGLFGGGSGDAGMANATTGPSTVDATTTAEPTDERAATGATPTSTTTSATQAPATTVTTTRTEPATPTDTATPTATGASTATPTPAETATPVAPTVESFTVTDRSDGGTARFDVGWNVTDADSDLVAVRVTLVADPDGEARTVAQRRFDAGGAQSSGETTFEVSGGSGAAYELSIEVVDTSGNTAFELARVVADGSPDG
jgi:cytoskeletal protein RodZ